MERIKSITEAFSMQPVTKTVTEITERRPFTQDDDIKEIKPEEVWFGENP